MKNLIIFSILCCAVVFTTSCNESHKNEPHQKKAEQSEGGCC
ncbi:hypothetical protein AAEX28_07775 [Lentisphaerota bacterium WC36G]